MFYTTKLKNLFANTAPNINIKPLIKNIQILILSASYVVNLHSIKNVLNAQIKANNAAPTFTKSFSLKFINDNARWYIPTERNTYAQVAQAHN